MDIHIHIYIYIYMYIYILETTRSLSRALRAPSQKLSEEIIFQNVLKLYYGITLWSHVTEPYYLIALRSYNTE